MKNGFFIHSLLAAALGLGFGESAWAVSTQNPYFSWPEFSRGQFYLAGMGLGLAFAWAQAAFWRLAFGWQTLSGLRIASFSLLPALMGFAWPLVIKLKLPAPHDFQLRNLQILLAAQCLLPLFISLVIAVLGIWRSRSLQAWQPRSLAIRLGGIAFVVYFLSGIWVGQWNNTGDAPHYLLISHSLMHDHDVDLANNYAEQDWRLIYDRELKVQDPYQKDGRNVSEHKPGISVLLGPGLYLLGLSGTRWTLGLVAAWGAALVFLLCLSLNFSRTHAVLGWALFSFTAPWWVNSQLAMSELPGGICFLVVLAAWKGVLPKIWAPLACAALAWLNVRFFPVALLMAGMDAWGRRREGVLRAALPLAITGLSLALALLYNLLQFGHLSPAEAYEQRDMSMQSLIKPWMAYRYASGLLIDQEYGWLPYAPAFGLAIFGLKSWWTRDRGFFWLTLIPALVYLAPVASFPWWPSAMTPNRYLVILTPAFALWSLEAFRAWGMRPGFALLAGLGWFWGIFLTLLPWFCFGKLNGRNMLLEIAGRALHIDLPSFFPRFWVDDPKSYFWVLGLMIAVVLWSKALGAPKK